VPELQGRRSDQDLDCEAKWWFRDGEEVPLASVIGLVVEK